jgi:hypothetical protein
VQVLARIMRVLVREPVEWLLKVLAMAYYGQRNDE